MNPQVSSPHRVKRVVRVVRSTNTPKESALEVNEVPKDTTTAHPVLRWLNNLSPDHAHTVFRRCCGSSHWEDRMVAARPFTTEEALFAAADRIWNDLDKEDALEAFDHHPRIGADLNALRKKFASTADWAAGEQRGAAEASEETLEKLKRANIRYEEKFGYIFIICATGKTAMEMLKAIKNRMFNRDSEELAVAKGEQHKITLLRLRKLLDQGH